MSASNHTKDFLVEIGTEELPPKALLDLSRHFAQSIEQQLSAAQFNFAAVKSFATPRRLAVSIEQLQSKQADYNEEKLGPPVSAAFDKDGKATKVAEGFARSNNVSVEALEKKDTDKGLRLALSIKHQGKRVEQLLPSIIDQALQSLPIPKRMRWGASRSEFIRPVHWLLMLLDEQVVDCEILGLKSDRKTFGHRFHHPQALNIKSASDYEDSLAQAQVIVDFKKRRDMIRQQAKEQAKSLGGVAKIDDDLLNEVCSLVELPVALSGKFDEAFLDVPSEALISSMQEHQKYFPVFDSKDNLLAHFITISNIKSSQPQTIISGNERVIRPRLSDAAFFFNKDKEIPLADRVANLKTVTFQNQLGSLFDKVERVKQLATFLAEQVKHPSDDVLRAAQLCKADLTTDMVFEFSDLQGIAGYYYAQHSGENKEVAQAIKEHYLPKFSGDALPQSMTGTLLAIADRIDTLVGIFGINQIPTGSKDPFALRRASLSVLRLMIEKQLDLDLKNIIEKSYSLYGDTLKGDTNKNNANAVQDSLKYVLERLRAWYDEQNIATHVYLSVASKQLSNPLDFDKRIHAVEKFTQLSAASSLAAANKRVSNLLAKAENTSTKINKDLLEDGAENTLVSAIESAQKDIKPLIENDDYAEILVRLSELQTPVDDFFEGVMVMSDDDNIRQNRLAILENLGSMFLNVADISQLAVKS